IIFPVCVLLVYSFFSVRYQLVEHLAPIGKIIYWQSGFYLGIFFTILTSFLYFYRVYRNVLKYVLNTITNPSVVREFIPYDSIDRQKEGSIVASTYLDGRFKTRLTRELKNYSPRLLTAVLRRHHRNAVFATI